jgi:hypothetical protein
MELYTRQDITDATHLPSEAEAERARRRAEHGRAVERAIRRASHDVDLNLDPPADFVARTRLNRFPDDEETPRRTWTLGMRLPAEETDLDRARKLWAHITQDPACKRLRALRRAARRRRARFFKALYSNAEGYPNLFVQRDPPQPRLYLRRG